MNATTSTSTRLNFEVSEHQKRSLRVEAAKKGITMAEAMRALLDALARGDIAIPEK